MDGGNVIGKLRALGLESKAFITLCTVNNILKSLKMAWCALKSVVVPSLYLYFTWPGVAALSNSINMRPGTKTPN